MNPYSQYGTYPGFNQSGDQHSGYPIIPPPYPHNNQTIVIINQDNNPVCQFCQKNASTVMRYKIGKKVIFWAACLFITTMFCCCIPCCIQECKDREFVCSNCQMVRRVQEQPIF